MSNGSELNLTLVNWANAKTDVAFAVCDRSGTVLECNRAFAASAGQSAESCAGGDVADFLAQPPKSPLLLALRRAQLDGEAGAVISITGPDGIERQWEYSIEFDSTTELLFLMGTDLSRVAQLSAELQTRTIRDRLTGLENRDALRDELAMVLSSKQPVVLFLLDIDGFTNVNDTFGHEFGDAVLLVISRRLRRVAGARSLVARVGGDQFAFMIRWLDDPEAAQRKAEELHSLLSGEMLINQTKIHLRISIGYAGACATTSTSASDLLREADTALSRAATDGGDKIRMFHPEYHHELEHRMQTEADLRLAVGTPQLDAAVQGIFDLESRTPYGFEALARWRHPERGPVPPDEFIGVADRHGLLDDVLRAVLERSLAALHGWLCRDPSRRLSVNVAPSQLFNRRAVDIVGEALDMWGLPPHQLILEITERELVADAAAIETLSDLRAVGVELAIDDFGAGASSLGYLWKLPVSVLKLDRSLITSISGDATARHIVAGLVQMATELDLRVVAEGVEHEHELEMLAEIGCPLVQGYVLHRPCPLAELDDLIADNGCRPLNPAAISGH